MKEGKRQREWANTRSKSSLHCTRSSLTASRFSIKTTRIPASLGLKWFNIASRGLPGLGQRVRSKSDQEAGEETRGVGG